MTTTKGFIGSYEQYNKYRSPQWHYDRILQLMESRGRKRNPDPRYDDKFVVEGLKFMRKWDRLSTDESPEAEDKKRRTLFPHNPGLFYAYETYLQPDGDNIRSVLEARILAQQQDEEIADRIHTIPDDVQWYEALFFNVRDRIDNSDYIDTQIIGNISRIGLQNVTFDLLIKFFGYYGGPVVLEEVKSAFDRAIKRPEPGQSSARFFAKVTQSSLIRQAAEAINPMDVNRYNITGLLDTATHLMLELEKAESGEAVATNLEESIAAVLTAIPWTVGRKTQAHLEQSPLKDYIGHAVEPRAAELFKIAKGEEVPHLDEILDNPMPTPKAREEDK